MIGLAFDDPWVLWLLPLAALPLLLADGGRVIDNGWLAHAPRDRLSEAAGWALRTASAVALAALVVAMAGPYRPEYEVDRVGQGAEIVLLLDRSRSMDQGFAPSRPPAARGAAVTPEVLDYYFSQSPARLRESKGQAARRLLAAFTARRPEDRFALIAFSTLPMRVLDFTDKPAMIAAAIEAGNIGRGLSETNIGRALEVGMELFEGRPYNGSRILMLVSDGGDRMAPELRDRLKRLAHRQRVAIYWFYLRSANSPVLALAQAQDEAAAQSVPELLLHDFFQSLQTPYRLYEAGDTQSLQRAIDDVGRQEKLPIVYRDLVPRRDLTPLGLAVALAAVLLLLTARLLEIRRWA